MSKLITFYKSHILGIYISFMNEHTKEDACLIVSFIFHIFK